MPIPTSKPYRCPAGKLTIGIGRNLDDVGITREEAYQLVQTPSMECWKTGESFESVILKDPEIGKILSPEEIRACFDLKVQLRNVDEIFRRVGLI